MKRIRVMVIEDSLVIRTYLEHIIGRDDRLELVASLASAEEALRELPRTVPDVISLDIRLPSMNGLEATLRIMSEHPTPIVVLAANVDADDLNISMNALRAGALAVLEKPIGVSGTAYETIAAGICDQLVSMSVVKVVRQRSARTMRADGSIEVPSLAIRTEVLSASTRGPFRALGLVASTGGPNALVAILSKLPPDFPLPILLVQHITSSFLSSFVTWLDGLCPFKVAVARDGDYPLPGRVYLAPVDHHLQLDAGRISLRQTELVCLQRPSGSVLFQSMAQSLGKSALGVLLTGMGEDGAEGLRAIHSAGGYTLAEDESTCIVYGMPAAAVRLGAVHESLPLDQIAGRLAALAASSERGIKSVI